MTTPFRLGIVGANPERGWARDAHIPALATIPEVSIHAVSARTREIAETAAKTFGAGKAFDDSIALARHPDVDIVVVTVKVPEHRNIVLAALEANKHVYCEWPLGRDLAEAEEMAALAKQAKGHTVIGLQGNVSAALLRAVELLEANALGRLLRMKVFSPTAGWAAEAPPFYAYLNDRSTGATLATITGGHTLAFMEKLAGHYTEIDARTSILRPRVRISGSDDYIDRSCADHMLVLGKHRSGCVSSLEVVGGQGVETPFLLELYGTDGQLTLTSNHPGGFQVGNLALYLNGEQLIGPQDSSADTAGSSLTGPPANVATMYRRLLSDIAAGTHTAPNFDDAARLTRLLQCIDAASDEGCRKTFG